MAHLRKRAYIAVLFALAVSITVLLFGLYVAYSGLARSRLSNEGEFFAPETVQSMAGQAATARAKNYTSRTTTRKVVFLMLDGCRQTFFEDNVHLTSVLNDAAFSVDVKRLLVRAELPTLSVPNYVAMYTGSPPELTGVFGNSQAGPSLKEVLEGNYEEKPYDPISYDNVFKTAGQMGLSFAARVFDNAAGEVWYEALSAMNASEPRTNSFYVPQPPTNYSDLAVSLLKPNADLSFMYFDDIDSAGHAGATDTKRLALALDNAAVILRTVFTLADTNTVVVVTGDHGMLDKGGHGGVEDHVRNVPFVLFQKGSGLAATTGPSQNLPRFRLTGDPNRMVDVAPTLAALLGVPVPAQNQGAFIDDALVYAGYATDQAKQVVYEDLLNQQRLFLRTFKTRVDQTGDAFIEAEQPSGNSFADRMNSIRDLTNKLRASFEASRRDDEELETAYVPWVAFVICASIGVVLWGLFINASYELPLKSVRAFFVGMFIVWLYYAIVLILFGLIFGAIYRVDEQFVWNSSQLDTVNGASLAVVLTLIGFPALAVLPIKRFCKTESSFIVSFLRTEKWSKCEYEHNLVALYLVRTYELFWMTIMQLLFAVIGSQRVLFIEGLYDVPYVSERTWRIRFVVSHVILMSLPLVFTTFLQNVFVIHKMRSVFTEAQVVAPVELAGSSSVNAGP